MLTDPITLAPERALGEGPIRHSRWSANPGGRATRRTTKRELSDHRVKPLLCKGSFPVPDLIKSLIIDTEGHVNN